MSLDKWDSIDQDIKEPQLADVKEGRYQEGGDVEATDRRKYRQEGVVINEVDEGQACLSCKDKCKGYVSHNWRVTCQSCKCRRDVHEIYHQDFVNLRERLGWAEPADVALRANKDTTIKLGYTWVPPGLTRRRIEEYMDKLDNSKVPRTGSTGARARDMQLMIQLPKQDLSHNYCSQLKGDEEKQAFEEFCMIRDTISMDIAVVEPNTRKDSLCRCCQKDLETGEVAVFAGRMGEGTAFHPACFSCSSCKELLVDLHYCHHNGQLYCQRHYAELVKPRCAGCDELIFSGEYTKAMDQDWHTGHFCCFNCDMSLTGHRYILREEHPYCIKCYENLFANTCEECKTPIGTDSKDLSYKDKHWHEKCFKCCDCQTSLVDQPFASKNEKLYCAECHDNNFAARCDGCGNIFRAGMKKYEYRGKQWHEQCFLCKMCQQPIGNKSFIPRDQEVVCVPCYEEHFAQRCMKCNGVINKGGITYKGTPWHRDCFTCTHCQKVLAGEKFTSREEKPYCADCFGELFAKKCIKCTKPITGLGGTKFISFEEKHWHSDCFNCYKCSTSLVGRGFLTDGDDILCPDCGRA